MALSVIFETSVILPASIHLRVAEREMEHTFYSHCKGCINLIDKKIIEGFTTFTIEGEAEATLDKVLKDTLKKYETDIRKEDLNIIYIFSKLLDKVERNYKEIIRKMNRKKVYDQEVKDILKKEINPFYLDKYKKIMGETPRGTWSTSPRYIRTAKSITEEQKNKYQNMKEKIKRPGTTDEIIVSEAIWLKRNYFINEDLYLLSNDTAISGYDKELYEIIPKSLEEDFKILSKTSQSFIKKFSKG